MVLPQDNWSRILSEFAGVNKAVTIPNLSAKNQIRSHLTVYRRGILTHSQAVSEICLGICVSADCYHYKHTLWHCSLTARD